MQLILEIILDAPPPRVDYAVQKGSGNNFKAIQHQVSDGGNLRFLVEANIKTQKDGTPDFWGACIQGPVNGRFIYVGIGTFAGQSNSAWNRRLKVPLRDISWETINQALADPSLILQATVAGTGKDGTPTCATVKPFGGWHLVKEQ